MTSEQRPASLLTSLASNCNKLSWIVVYYTLQHQYTLVQWLPYVCHSAMPTKGTRTGPKPEMHHFCIDFAGRRFLPRHFNHLPTGHTYTLTRVKPKPPMRQYNCTMGNKKIYIMDQSYVYDILRRFVVYSLRSTRTEYVMIRLRTICSYFY